MSKAITVFHWVTQANEILKNNGFENTLFEARFLAAVSLKQNLSWILSHPHSLINDFIANSYLDRRLKHEPLAYIAGKKEFWGRDFIVDSRVLIPRQETEELIEVALGLLDSNSNSSVLDLCTGSGCIGITLKLERPLLEVSASDISLSALEVAKMNAQYLGAEIQWYQGDLFGFNPKNCFDLIICNPPYIASTDILNREIYDYEPPHALWAEKNGFHFYERISVESMKYISNKGKIVLEIGYNQAEIIKRIFHFNQWVFNGSKQDLFNVERCMIFQRFR